MTFTKETWLGMAGIAALVTYFFWPKKAAASSISTAKPAATAKPVAKPSGYVAPKPAAKPAYTPPPYGTPSADTAPPPYGTPSSDTTPAPDATPAPDTGMGESGMTATPDSSLTSGTRLRVGHVSHGSNDPFAGQRGTRLRSLVGHVSHGSNIPAGRQLSHGMPREWWTAIPRVTGADLGMWTPPARVGSGPHVFQGKDYNPTSAWAGPVPMFAQIPGFSDYDFGFAYGRASCMGRSALMMRPAAPSDDWLTGYDTGCASARGQR